MRVMNNFDFTGSAFSRSVSTILTAAVAVIGVFLFVHPAIIEAAQTTISALPYTASANNDTLQLAGTKLTSTGNGLLISGDNTVLNLGNDTLVFGSAGGSAIYGIRIQSGVNVKIIGGLILKSGSAGSGITGIKITGSNNVLVSNTDVIVDGHDANCVWVEGGMSSTYNVEFAGGDWTSNSESYSSRESYSGAVFQCGSLPATAGQFDLKIHGINILNGPGQGMVLRGHSFVYDNTIMVDAYNKRWDTVWDWNQAPIGQSWANPYCIMARGLEAGAEIYNNHLLSGTKRYGSRGVLIELGQGTVDKPILFHDNVLDVHEGPNKEAGNSEGNVQGFRIRYPEDSNLIVYNNVFRTTVDDNPATTWIGKEARTFYHGTGGRVDIHNNLIQCVSLTQNTTPQAFCIEGNNVSSTAVYRYNRIEGSGELVRFGGIQGPGNGIRFEGDTLSFLPYTVAGKSTYHIGYYNAPSTDNYAIDCVYLNGASDTNIIWQTSTSANSEISLARNLVVKTNGNNALPVSGAAVTVTNAYGQTVLTGTTDGYGKLTGQVVYWYESEDTPDSTSFNPFTVKVKKGSDSVFAGYAVNWQTASPTFTLANTTGSATPNSAPTVPTHYLPSADTVTSAPITVVVNNSTDIEGNPITYSFWISRDQNFTQIADSVKNKSQQQPRTSASFTFVPTAGQRYWWRASASDGANSSAYSIASSFVYASLATGDACLTAPSVPGLSSPSNGSGAGALQPSLCVLNSTPAPGCAAGQTYNFEIYSDSNLVTKIGATGQVNQNANGTTCYTPPSALLGGRSYWWRARCSNGTVSSGWAGPFRFTTPNTNPSTPTLVSPVNADTLETLKPAFVVNASTDPDGNQISYLFQVSTVSNFSTIAATATVTGSGAQISWTSSASLLNNTLYYWRVRASDGIGNSAYSTSRSFRVLIASNTAPSAPAIVSPIANAVVALLSPQLVVSNGADPNGDVLTYQFEIYTATGQSLVASASGIAQASSLTRWTVSTALNDSTTYQWRARCFDGSLYSPWTSYSAFSTLVAGGANNPPSVPANADPSANSTVVTKPIDLTVTNSVDSDDDPLTYSFFVYADAGLTVLLEAKHGVAEGNNNQTSVTLSLSPVEGDRYYWRSFATDGADTSAFSNSTWFKYSDPATGGNATHTKTDKPNNGDKVKNGKPTLTATNITEPGTHDYYFEVASDSDFASVVVASNPVPQDEDGATDWQLTETLVSGQIYFWRVRADDYPFSAVSNFVVDEQVYAYPNPVKFLDGDLLTFHLGSDAVDLLIQTVSGETVLIANDVSGDYIWDGYNASGHRVAIGVYTWAVAGTSYRGKIVVKP
jgi:hypothetical protein